MSAHLWLWLAALRRIAGFQPAAVRLVATCCRLEVGDTAGWKLPLRAVGKRRRSARWLESDLPTGYRAATLTQSSVVRFIKGLAWMAAGLVCVQQARADAMLQLFNQTWGDVIQRLPEIAEARLHQSLAAAADQGQQRLLGGYDLFDPFDLGDKDQRGTVATRYGTKEELLRMVRLRTGSACGSTSTTS